MTRHADGLRNKRHLQPFQVNLAVRQHERGTSRRRARQQIGDDYLDPAFILHQRLPHEMEGRLRPRIGGECHGGVANLDGPHFIGRSIDQRVPERSAVGEEQLLQPVLTLWSHRESVHPPDGARPQHHFERRSGHMIAFVDEDHSVAGQRCHQVFHANQRRQHGNVESSSEPRAGRQAGRPQIIAGLGRSREASAAFGRHLAMDAAHFAEVGFRAARNGTRWRQPLTF